MNQLKSICFCLDTWYPYLGGGQDRVLNLANQLSSKTKVTILTRNLGSFKGHRLNPSIKLVQIGKPKPFNCPLSRIVFVFKALSYLNKHSFELIDFQPYSPWITAWILKIIKPRQRLIITVLGKGNQVSGMPSFAQPLFKKIYHHLIYKASWPLIISDTYHAVTKIKTSPTKIVPNGVNLDDYQVKSLKNSHQSLVFLGRFHHQKGIDVLLEAFAKVFRVKPNTTLTLIGSGPEKQKITKQINQLKLTSSVSLPGQMVGKNLIKNLKSKTIFVLPSRFEGQAISLLIAMACKLPIIATKVGDNQQLITSKSGILVDPENANQLAKAILKLLDSPSRSKTMGVEGYQLVKSYYTWDKIAHHYLDVLSNLKLVK